MTMTSIQSGDVLILSGVLVVSLFIWGALLITIDKGRDARQVQLPLNPLPEDPLFDSIIQKRAIERLLALPQFRELLDGTLIDWSTGAVIRPCDCNQTSQPHMMVKWGRIRSSGVSSRAYRDTWRRCAPASMRHGGATAITALRWKYVGRRGCRSGTRRWNSRGALRRLCRRQ